MAQSRGPSISAVAELKPVHTISLSSSYAILDLLQDSSCFSSAVGLLEDVVL